MCAAVGLVLAGGGVAAYAGTSTAPAPTIKLRSMGCSSDLHGATVFFDVSPASVTLTAASGNTTLVPAKYPNLWVNTAGPQRGGQIVPVAGRSGTAGITVTATDADGATAKATFTVRVGTAAADTITGTNGVDLVWPRAGSDVVNTAGGNDLVCDEDAVLSGDDQINTGAGNDIIRSGTGDDTVDAGPGNDLLVGSDGDDHLIGGPGADRFFGGAGVDTTDFDAAEGDVKDNTIP